MSSKKVLSSLAYKFTEKIFAKLIGFVIGVLLARLLAPEVFGVVAIITAITAFLKTFVDSGLNTALIQSKNADSKDYSTVFYISLGIAAGCYLLLFFFAPLITDFYEIPEYLLHFRILALTLLVSAFASIPIAKLTRELQFRKMLFCQLLATVISGALGVGMAFAGYGMWALIVYYLSDSVLACIFFLFAAKWYPTWAFSKRRAKELFSYGYKILTSGVLCSLFYNIRTFIIGKQYTKSELGVYSRGDQIPSIISTTVDNTFTSVMLPFYSAKQDEPSEIKRMLSKTISLNSYLNIPAMIGLAIIAPALVVLLYTQKWEACIPFLQLMALANISTSVTSPCLTAIKAIGRSDIFFKLEMVRRIFMIAILIASVFFGSLYAIAIGWVVSCFIDVFVIIVPTKRLIGYSVRDLFFDICPTLLVSLIMGAIVWLVGCINISNILVLLLQCFTGVVVYILLSVVFRLKSFTEIKVMVLRLLKHK